jgi:hypothetical protein
MKRIYIGYDPREAEAYAVCQHSLEHHIKLAGGVAGLEYEIRGLCLDDLRAAGLYTRPTGRTHAGLLWDNISGAPMSTEFAISRFLVPHLEGYQGWAMFLDCDMLWRADPRELFALADPQCAAMCVKHQYEPRASVKMDDQIQLGYGRKLWSSVMLFNCGHASNRALDVALINSVPGRDLHRFCWLRDEEIGSLPEAWNYIPSHSNGGTANLVHWTEGGPWFEGYRNVPLADEWREMRSLWLRSC